jgi:hypothetical protein
VSGFIPSFREEEVSMVREPFKNQGPRIGRRICADGAALVLPLLLFGACSSEPAKPVHVSGTVSVRGQPIPKGIVMIHPDKQQGNTGLYGTARISNGKFDTRGERGRGVRPGAVIFAIAGYGEQGSADDFSDSNALFPTYQLKEEITPERTIFDINIP